jgi:hypothetical protein
MPLLAEAAPDEFLEAVEAAVADPSASPFIDVFRQEGSAGGLSGWNYITGVLWALETLAWHPDFLGRATILLGDLASIDPGGNWGNRPRNSLVDIFLPWHAQTLADLPARRSALESLLREHPDVAWNALINLLPSTHGTTSGTRKPIWRSFIPPGWKETVNGDYWTQVHAYADMCTQIAAKQLHKLTQLVDRLASLPDPAFSQVLMHLSSSAVRSLPEEDRLPLWEALRDIALKHRKFAGAQWAMPAERVVKIEEVAGRLAPASFELANRRLFTERDFDLYKEKENFEEERQRIDRIRQDAIKTVLSTEGMDGIIRFVREVESPRKVGDALGSLEDPKIDAFLLPAFLDHDDRAVSQFLGSFVWRRFWTQNWAWLDHQLRQPWTKDQLLALLLLVPSEEQTWSRAEAILEGGLHSYWKQVRVDPWGLEPNALLEAAEKLTSNEQPVAAVDCLYVLTHKKVPIPLPLASAALLGALSTSEQQKKIDHYRTVDVIKWLQDNAPLDSDDLFRIEWNYLPLLDRLYGGEPKVLEYKLASSPEFFCEVIATIFRSDKEDKEKEVEVSEAQKRIAQNAYSLLHGWRVLPGSLLDGTFDGDKFAEWLDEVKKRCKESGHFRIAMDQLGQALAHAPQDPAGLWLHKSIMAALDSRDVPEMRRGFTAGLFNKRGVHGFSHGEEEKQIATGYRAKAKELSNSGFHRVADAVRGLAEDYELAAERERDFFDDR